VVFAALLGAEATSLEQPRPSRVSRLRSLLPGGAGSSRSPLYHLLHVLHKGDTVVDRVAVFMIGLPGAGKSRVIAERYALDRRTHAPLNSTVVLDLDKEMFQHPEYDPKDPDRLYLAKGREAYLWADARVEAQFAAALASGHVKRLVLDGTGTNSERQIRRMAQARRAGFFVKALYVRVPARTAIARAAMRKRGVKPERVLAYQTKMAHAMAVAAEHADEVEVVDVTFDDAPLPGTMSGTCVDPIGSLVGFG
jgi:shikimate kinase